MLSYTDCTLCAHRCHVNRAQGAYGRCRMGAEPVLARAALHMWEEPPISGVRGSGAVFFSGCSLGCTYCQNAPISHEGCGRAVSHERLTDIYLELQAQGAHNINLVTPTHFAPSVVETVAAARERGLHVPIVYNTSSFDTPETVAALRDTVDVYLADMKYVTSRLAARLSSAQGYPDAARAAIGAMVQQQPEPVLDEQGCMLRGVIARVLLLPGHVAEAKLCVRYLYTTFGDSIYISLMNQYTPRAGLPSPLHRTVTKEEYRDLLTYADKIGIKNGFTQDFGTATAAFTPLFDYTGI